jgi:hypothetical protein
VRPIVPTIQTTNITINDLHLLWCRGGPDDERERPSSFSFIVQAEPHSERKAGSIGQEEGEPDRASERGGGSDGIALSCLLSPRRQGGAAAAAAAAAAAVHEPDRPDPARRRRRR